MYSGFLLIGMSVFGPMADHISLQLLLMITGGVLVLITILFGLNAQFYKMPKVVSSDTP